MPYAAHGPLLYFVAFYTKKQVFKIHQTNCLSLYSVDFYTEKQLFLIHLMSSPPLDSMRKHMFYRK